MSLASRLILVHAMGSLYLHARRSGNHSYSYLHVAAVCALIYLSVTILLYFMHICYYIATPRILSIVS